MAKKFQLEQPPYRPFPRQIEFHISPAKYRLFGGAAGPGKSRALMEEAIQLAAENPGVNCLLLRRTYGELESSIIEPMRKFVLPFHAAQGAKYNESTRILRLPNGSNVYFGYCRNENDVYQYQGGEFFFIGIDELTHFTLKQWQFLTSRNRCPVKTNRPPGMAGATNPGNIGHAWVKALFIDHTTPPGWDIAVQPYEPNDYDFIRATLADNPIYANDVAYKTSLQALPANMRRAFLNGDWDIFAGQYFTNFEKSRHVVPRDYAQFDDWIQRWIGIDWGFGHNSAIYWNARLEDKRVFTYRELICNNLSPKQLGEFIVQHNQNDDLAAVYLSPDAYAKRENYITIADQISDVFRLSGFPMCQRADNDRVSGWSLMYDLLDTDQWVISEQCENLIETIPLAVRDPDYLEDILKWIGDDSIDACLIGSTKVFTKRGRIPLSEVVEGDFVGTREGWKKVISAGVTKKSAKVYRLKISDGRYIVGTGNHPVFSDGEYKRLDSLRYGAIVESWLPRAFNSMALLSEDIPIPDTDIYETTFSPVGIIKKKESNHYIGKSGRHISALSQRVVTSTMLEDFQTTFPICNAFQSQTMPENMALNERMIWNIWHESDRWLLDGMVRKMVESGMQPISVSPLPFEKDTRFLVNFVGLPLLDGMGSLDSAQINANLDGEEGLALTTSKRNVNAALPNSPQIDMRVFDFAHGYVLETTEESLAQDVYNLEVEDAHEYIANGMLVHNCRYSMKSHIKTSVVPLAERINRQVFTPEERQLMVQGGSLPDMTHRIRYMLELQKKQSPALLPAPIKRFKGRRQLHSA